MRRIDRTGERFGRLTVIYPVDGPQAPWLCHCDCGKSHIATGSNLVAGFVRSCGCFNQEALARRNRTHGLSHRREFFIWQGMKQRCYDRKSERFSSYGGRGIKVHPEWRHDFAAFFKHMGPRPSNLHSLDRINVDGDYEPGNVRWATRKEQGRNKRTNRIVHIDGKSMPFSQAAEEFGIGEGALRTRLKNGWSIERALKTKVRKLRTAV